jgi:hypothetical protein
MTTGPNTIRSLRVYLLVVCFSVACAVPAAASTPVTNSTSSQALTPEQAKVALDRKQEPKPGPGTWRYVDITTESWGTTFVTNYLLVTTNDQRFERIEETVHSTNKASSARNYISIKNSEGTWSLHQKTAILYPKQKSDSKDDDIDPSEKDFAALAVYSGERFTQGGRVLVRVVGELSAEARRKAVDLLLKRLKKEKGVPFFARVLMSTMKGMMADILPGRFEYVIEEQTGALIFDKQYDKDARLMSETYYWEPCPHFPLEKFSIPENLERIRPKNVKEADKLKRKTLAEEAKSPK